MWRGLFCNQWREEVSQDWINGREGKGKRREEGAEEGIKGALRYGLLRLNRLSRGLGSPFVNVVVLFGAICPDNRGVLRN